MSNDSGQVFAAQYVRMSTEHQQYSTANQEDAIREYAERRGYTIVRTYSDDGKSGLNLAGRDALQQLIADVQQASPGFSVILVYDVSRWGRFQDADESAHYEYLCKQAGIAVHYCAEQFENDGGIPAAVFKAVKRAMAGEYSRELSAKVFRGQCRLIELGFRQGGAPGFGLRRVLVDANGQVKGVLQRGERKSLQTDRVVLEPGPSHEVTLVQRMYTQFVEAGHSEREIATQLNAEGVRTDCGRQWTRDTVHQVLTNEKYLGHNVYNRTSFKLKKSHVHNDPVEWVRCDHAFPAIVSPEVFQQVQTILSERDQHLTDNEMLQHLKQLASQYITLSAELIDSVADIPSSAAYRSRFGSLLHAYELAGYVPTRDYSYVEINRRLRMLYSPMLEHIASSLQECGATVRQIPSTNMILVNGEFRASLILARCRATENGTFRWDVQFASAELPDVTILVRMNQTNDQPADYFLLPAIDLSSPRLALGEMNDILIDTYQFDQLEFLMHLASRRRIEVAA